MGKKYLKRKNAATITIFLVWSIALYIVLCSNINDFWADMLARVSNLTAKASLFCFLTPLILGIACGVLPASWKAVLVFWRKNPLPGCRAFTKLGPSDPRIDMKQLSALVGQLPQSPASQNAKWYSLYKQTEHELTVSEAHKAFLLYRDLTGVSFLFLVFGTAALIPARASLANTVVYAGICAAEYIVLSIVARNHGNRFVCNVLVEYLAKA
jgi:hypothetical protein